MKTSRLTVGQVFLKRKRPHGPCLRAFFQRLFVKHRLQLDAS